ncbi:hypothetical protein GYMLUDRAFT_248232 [Collybiopsis luxurians FD-317 M1]|uniref:Uncharacterized protein n=1 Tax=Collybiopsis luxurians FD-317 M1 TaxID=944289 RepID=A0A0D0C101_9AGAR|nr:hypothetical protein GYMLUDRAFT_248232 [Collybiopsis luxurians FD-317 M1]
MEMEVNDAAGSSSLTASSSSHLLSVGSNYNTATEYPPNMYPPVDITPKANHIAQPPTTPLPNVPIFESRQVGTGGDYTMQQGQPSTVQYRVPIHTPSQAGGSCTVQQSRTDTEQHGAGTIPDPGSDQSGGAGGPAQQGRPTGQQGAVEMLANLLVNQNNMLEQFFNNFSNNQQLAYKQQNEKLD